MNQTRTRKLLTIVSLILILCFLPFSNLVAWDPPASVVVIKDDKAAYFKRADGSDLQAGFYYIAGTNEIAYCADVEKFSGATSSGVTSVSVWIESGYLYMSSTKCALPS